MESLSPQVVSAAKLPILNPNEFDLWKMRIEQYFLMTDYSLWEVILNGDSLAPTRVIDGVLQSVAPTTVEQRLARKNESKARGTLLMALPDKHQLKFNTHKDAKTLMEAIEKSQSNSPKLDNDDLKQIDTVDLEEVELKWQMDMLIVECYNYHRKGHFARECRYPKDTRRNGAAEPQRRSVPMRNLPTMLLWLFLLQVLLLTMRSDESLPPNPIYDRYQSGNGYHVVPPPYTGTFMPPKPDLVFNNVPNAVETDHYTFSVKLSPTKPDQDLSHTHRPSSPIIEDWVSDSKDESEIKTPQNVLSFVQPSEQVKSPRPYVQHVETSISPANSKTTIPKPTSSGKRRNRKACFVCKSLDHLIKDCDYHEKKMAQTTARSHAKRGTHMQYAQMSLPNPQRHVVPTAVLTQSKLVTITAVRQVTTAVPKTSNLVRGLPSKVFENDNTCVACKKGKQHRASCVQEQFDAEKAGEEIVQQYVLFPVWSSGSTNPYNADRVASFDEKEPDFEGRKLESEVNVSPSSSAQSKKHDDRTKREAKGKSPVESLIRYRN
nr:hypothetical protein [Tanacetum cinerariifolium]